MNNRFIIVGTNQDKEQLMKLELKYRFYKIYLVINLSMLKKQNVMILDRKYNQLLNVKTSGIKYPRGISTINNRVIYPEIKTEEKIIKLDKRQTNKFDNIVYQRVPLLKQNSYNIGERMISSGNIGNDKQKYKQRNQQAKPKQQQKLFENIDYERKSYLQREKQWQLEKQRQKQRLEKEQRQFQQKKQKEREALYYENQRLKRQSSKIISKPVGIVGLANIGNTCFMNSTLQCMFNIPEFNQYFTSGKYLTELKSNGKVADAYARLVSNIRSTNCKSEIPTNLKNAIANRNPIFSGYAQQDSQQFLVMLLQSLGEDLSRVNKKAVVYKELTADLKKHSLQQISDDWWKYYKQREDSIIFDYFSGQLMSKVICLKCQNQSIAFDNFLDLSLSFSKSQSINQLQRMIEAFLKEQLLTDDYFCSACKLLRQCKRKFTIYRLPHVLIIQLKRFSYGKWKKQKITSRINFPDILDLSRFINESKDKSVRNPIYRLIGVVNHSGGIDFGHYTAECRNPFNNRWYNFNDSMVSQSSFNDRSSYQSSSPYLLFYYKD